MSESMGGGFTQSTSPTSGLTAYGWDAPQKTPKTERVKSRLKRLARQHRVAQSPAMRKSIEDNKMATTYETLLNDLRKAVDAAAVAPEVDRKEILSKAFEELDTGLTAELNAAVEESAGANVLVDFAESLAKSAGDDEELAKGLTDVADFAFALQGVEHMIERMAAIADGTLNFPSVGEVELTKDDSNAQRDHANAILDIITPYYAMGLVALQRLTGATIADEEGNIPTEAESDAILKADLGLFYAGVANQDIAPEHAQYVLAKAFTGPGDPSTTDPNDDSSSDDDQDGMDDGDVDPLETIKRLAAAILLQTDAIIQADGGDESPEDEAPDQTGAPQPAPAVQKADIARMLKTEVDQQLNKALDPLISENAELRAELETLKKSANPNIGNKGSIDPNGRSIVETTVENLAKMSPEDARREIFKAALSNRSE